MRLVHNNVFYSLFLFYQFTWISFDFHAFLDKSFQVIEILSRHCWRWVGVSAREHGLRASIGGSGGGGGGWLRSIE